jgi:hypothetical protein
MLSALIAGSQQLVRRVLVLGALAFACALSVTIGLGLLTCALYEALRLHYGAVTALFGLGGIYLIVAGILYLCYRRARSSSAGNTSSGLSREQARNAETLDASAQAGEAPQAVALALGAELVKQMTPLQLTILAAISGFVAGRRL